MRRDARLLLPHERLLVACAASRPDEASRCAVKAALSLPDMDWPAACTMSVRHGLAQHVALHLREFANDPRIPPSAAAAFARMYGGNAHRNQVLFRETARLLRALKAAGIRCLVLKGVALALTVYPDPALRNFADIDILVDPENFEAAGQVAQRCGFLKEGRETEPLSHEQTYVLSCPEDILTDTLAPEFDPSITPDILARCRHRVVLEIHRGLFRDAVGLWRSVDLDIFWESPPTAVLPDGTPFLLSAPEATLVYLAAHAADHAFRRLMHFLDIAEAIRHYGPTIDWTCLTDIARRCEVSDNLFRALELVRREFGACVPADVLPGLLGGRVKRAGHRLTLPDVFRAMQASRSENRLRRWFLSQNSRQRIVSLLHLIAPPPATMRRVYGVQDPFLVAALYLYRPFQMAGRLARVLFRRNKRVSGE